MDSYDVRKCYTGARLSEICGRVEDMIENLYDVQDLRKKAKNEMFVEERNLFSNSFYLLARKRLSEIESLKAFKDDNAHLKCILNNLEEDLISRMKEELERHIHIVRDITSPRIETKADFGKMHADALRYMYKIVHNEEKKKIFTDAENTYIQTLKKISSINKAHPCRLKLVINFSVFYAEFCSRKGDALKILKDSIDDEKEVSHLPLNFRREARMLFSHVKHLMNNIEFSNAEKVHST